MASERTGSRGWPEALKAAALGREARESLPPDFNPDSFTQRDYGALEDRWKALGQDAGEGGRYVEGAVDDDLDVDLARAHADHAHAALAAVVAGVELRARDLLDPSRQPP